MRKCPQCNQLYDDATNFCLTDGSTLFPVADQTMSSVEIPTVIGSAPNTFEQPAPTQFMPAPNDSQFGRQQIPITQNQPPPFTPPAQTAPKSGSSALTYLIVAFFALLVGGALVGGLVYFLRDSSEPEVKTSVNANANTAKKDELDAEKAKLKTEQEKLDADKKRLEEERKALENKKKATPAPTVPPSTDSRTAYIIDPPTNIRATPNGRIICVVRERNTPVNILGSTGVTDNNGSWYYTDACGSRGVIHSSQIRF